MGSKKYYVIQKFLTQKVFGSKFLVKNKNHRISVESKTMLVQKNCGAIKFFDPSRKIVGSKKIFENMGQIFFLVQIKLILISSHLTEVWHRRPKSCSNKIFFDLKESWISSVAHHNLFNDCCPPPYFHRNMMKIQRAA